MAMYDLAGPVAQPVKPVTMIRMKNHPDQLTVLIMAIRSRYLLFGKLSDTKSGRNGPDAADRHQHSPDGGLRPCERPGLVESGMSASQRQAAKRTFLGVDP